MADDNCSGAATVVCNAQATNMNYAWIVHTTAEGSTWVSDKSFSSGDLWYTGDNIASTLGIAMYRIRRAGLWNQRGSRILGHF